MSPVQVLSNPGPYPHVLRWVMRPFYDGALEFDYKCLVCGCWFGPTTFDATPAAKFSMADIWNALYRHEQEAHRIIGDELCPCAPGSAPRSGAAPEGSDSC